MYDMIILITYSNSYYSEYHIYNWLNFCIQSPSYIGKGDMLFTQKDDTFDFRGEGWWNEVARAEL